MMSSVDMSSSSAGSSSTPRTVGSNPPLHMQHPQSRHATFSGPMHHPRSSSPAPHPHLQGAYHGGSVGGGVPPGAEAGRLKTEQVVLEFLYKVTEVVLQSRVHLQNEAGLHGPNTRRGRFNLDIEEIQYVRESMGAWREDVHLPLTVDIYWDGDGDQRVLLERWNVVYTNGLSAAPDQFDTFDFQGRRYSSTGSLRSAKNYTTAGNTRNVLEILKEVLKKFTVQLRALHAFMRLLPAHRFFRQSYPSNLSYEIHSCDDIQLAQGFSPDIATSQYSFLPINTPFGFIKVATLYRRDCSALEKRRKRVSKEIFQENFIIQDYVPASPELMPGSAPPIRDSPASSISSSPRHPITISASDEEAIDRRRRSSPETAIDGEKARVVSPRRLKQLISQPMAIPQQVKSPMAIGTSFEEHSELTTTSVQDNAATKPVAILQHPHSYGEPDRLRSVGTNPNVTPAPYGYGNVTIERGQTPPLHGTSSSGFSGGGGSYQDHHLSSPHPLSTPPRHPHSLLTPRTAGRTSFISSINGSTAGKKSSNEYAYRASLENFSLDTSGPSHSHPAHVSPSSRSPSPSPSAIGPSGRSQTFHFGAKRDSFESPRIRTPESSPALGPRNPSPHLSPTFMAESPSRGARDERQRNSDDPTTTEALVLRRMSLDQSPTLTSVPAFALSPPFQPNPTELLSTSPGYSHSKHFQALRRDSSPSHPSSDTSTGRSGSFRLTFGSTTPVAADNSIVVATSGTSSGVKSLIQNKTGPFSTDIDENSVGIWGISPDSPDTFSLSIGASTRRRFLSSSADSSGAGATNSEVAHGTAEDSGVDSDMMLLPFALGSDADHSSTATTVTATSSLDDRPSTLGLTDSDTQPQSSSAWDTASVGSFLQQLKNAPRLQTNGAERLSNENIPTSGAGVSRESATSAAPSFFDDELESFRNLRNQLAQEL